MTVVKVKSDVYYELAEKEDEGVHFLYQLPGNKILSFGGQEYYYEGDDEWTPKWFPNDDFEILEGRGLKNELLLFDIYIYGKRIAPARVISGKDKWTLWESAAFSHGEIPTIIDGRLEDFIPAAVAATADDPGEDPSE